MGWTSGGRLGVLFAILLLGATGLALLGQVADLRLPGPLTGTETTRFSTEIDHVRYYPGEDIVTYRTDEGGLANFTATGYAQVECRHRIMDRIREQVHKHLGNGTISGFTSSGGDGGTLMVGIGDPRVTADELRQILPDRITCHGHIQDTSATETKTIQVREPDFARRRPHLNQIPLERLEQGRVCTTRDDAVSITRSENDRKITLNGTVDIPSGVDPVRFKTSSLLIGTTLHIQIDTVLPRILTPLGCVKRTGDDQRPAEFNGIYNLTYRIPPDTTIEDIIVIHDGRQVHPVRLDPNLTRR